MQKDWKTDMQTDRKTDSQTAINIANCLSWHNSRDVVYHIRKKGSNAFGLDSFKTYLRLSGWYANVSLLIYLFITLNLILTYLSFLMHLLKYKGGGNPIFIQIYSRSWPNNIYFTFLAHCPALLSVFFAQLVFFF